MPVIEVTELVKKFRTKIKRQGLAGSFRALVRPEYREIEAVKGIYRGVVHWLIYSLIPAGFIAFLPLRIMKVFSWPWLGLLIAIDLAYVAGSYFLFKLGLKRYESGNLVVSKL